MMMGSISNNENDDDQLNNNNYYAESTVFVAVGKQVKESESVVLWAAKKFLGKKRICILHIHQPAQLLSLFDAGPTTSKLKQRAVEALRDSHKQKLHKLLDQYVGLLSHGKHADRMWIEMDNIEKGIVDMIVQNGIKWLVMGAASDKRYTKEMSELKSEKAIFVCEHAPDSCHIWFTCRGNLVHTRQGRRTFHGADISPVPKPPNLNVPASKSVNTVPDNHSADIALEPKSVDAIAEVIIHDSDSDTSSETSSPRSKGPTEEKELMNDHYLDTGSVDSDVVNEELIVESLDSNNVNEVPEEIQEDFLGAEIFSTHTNSKCADSEPARTGHVNDEHGSPPRLTSRERGSVLRAHSVDFDSEVDSSRVSYSAQKSAALHNCVNVKKESYGVEGKRQKFAFRSSLNSAMFEHELSGKAKLQAPREMHDRLEIARSDAENLKEVAFQESMKRWKEEDDAVDAKNKAEAAVCKYDLERKQRKEAAEALQEQKLECERLTTEHNKFSREFAIVRDHCSRLENQARESELAVVELEKKMISAAELLISFRAQRDKLQIELDDVIQERGRLRMLKEQRVALSLGPQFSTFSLLEISDATCNFDESKRIGNEEYGSTYLGVLRHMKVAIRMLPNDGSRGQWRFEQKVEILSRIRHPNIITLVGFCPEERAIVYEYLEKGSLEDHLSSGGRNPPLQWQTRVKIATELCSALIFLHTNKPPIFHGILNPSNVLLDANFVCKIGDVGITCLAPQNRLKDQAIKQLHSEYMDPEFSETGVLSPSSDVFSFGVILLRLLTGRSASELVEAVHCAMKTGQFDLSVDHSAGEWPIDLATTLAQLAVRCCYRRRSIRPDLASEVWSVLVSCRDSSSPQVSSLKKKENHRPPPHFLCPIYQEVMTDPCIAADGFTYEGDAIRGWFDSGHKKSPMTNLELPNCNLIPNHALLFAIQEWLQQV